MIAAFLSALIAATQPAGAAAVPTEVTQLPGDVLRTYLRADDYPVEALQSGAQGRSSFEVLVGTDGRVKSCAITQSSGSTVLDTQTCSLMSARLRFQPGLDEDGRPAEARMAGSLDWRLP